MYLVSQIPFFQSNVYDWYKYSKLKIFNTSAVKNKEKDKELYITRYTYDTDSEVESLILNDTKVSTNTVKSILNSGTSYQICIDVVLF
jgi:hypothetical protein